MGKQRGTRAIDSCQRLAMARALADNFGEQFFGTELINSHASELDYALPRIHALPQNQMAQKAPVNPHGALTAGAHRVALFVHEWRWCCEGPS